MGAVKSIPVGTVFARLTVIGPAPMRQRKNGQNISCSECRCECNSVVIVCNHELKRKGIRSCGCLRSETVRDRQLTHGASRREGKNNAEYVAWRSMLTRVTNSQAINFDDYGGRGITVCDRWLNSFESFLEDMGPKPSKAHSLDRINNNGNYEPGNCRWATQVEQNNNTRRNRYVTVSGVSKTVSEWAMVTGMPHAVITARLNNGWSDELAVLTPVQRRTRKEPQSA